jgi:Uma2 family endonuclease
MTGEIINGELIATPRPSRKHTSAASRITMEIGPPYEYGRGGPGGWIIMVEPEIGLGPHILVPDLAGWKKERFPVEEETNYITVPPNWVCEVLSPQTFRTDKVKKMPLYAKHGVDYIWLIDPVAMTLDAFSLASGQWLLLSSFAENDQVRIEPFPEVEIYLGDLWLK